VYAEAGFRGATTRRIADEAGVNEITIFRLFGSKAALIEAALRARTDASGNELVALPRVPAEPERELAAWAASHLGHLRANREFIRKTLAEVEERPEMAPTICGGWCDAEHELRDYVRRLRRLGFMADPATDACGIKVDLDVAVKMFTSALFSDAMGRDVMPDMYPQPAERAPLLYVRCFLRAVALRRVERGTVRGSVRKPAPRQRVASAHSSRRSSPRVHP
jgi:AcrR family transcriptional regulator